MGLGVDTASSLSSINWVDFYDWKNAYPTFAGRYFGGGGGLGYSTGEFKSVNEKTGMTLIFPIQGAAYGTSNTGRFYYGQQYYSTEGTTGYHYGVHDATQLCDTMANALSTTELHIPSSGLVIAYLDVESDLNSLKSAYWAGWANTVHTYQLSGTSTKPFVPGIYCGYTTSGGKYVVPSDIQTVFDNAAGYWTHSNVRCRGLWTAEPFLCKYCTSTADVSSDWGQFATAKQTLQTGTVEVPLYLWQYAEHGEHTSKVTSGCTYYCGYSNFAGGQNLDLDGSDSRDGETYMFNIVS